MAKLFVTTFLVTPTGKRKKSPGAGTMLFDQLAALVQLASAPAPRPVQIRTAPQATAGTISNDTVSAIARNGAGRMFPLDFVFIMVGPGCFLDGCKTEFLDFMNLPSN